MTFTDSDQVFQTNTKHVLTFTHCSTPWRRQLWESLFILPISDINGIHDAPLEIYAVSNISRESLQKENHAIIGYVKEFTNGMWEKAASKPTSPQCELSLSLCVCVRLRILYKHTHRGIVPHKQWERWEAASCLWVGQDVSWAGAF